jgi:hypothetical protein
LHPRVVFHAESRARKHALDGLFHLPHQKLAQRFRVAGNSKAKDGPHAVATRNVAPGCAE